MLASTLSRALPGPRCRAQQQAVLAAARRLAAARGSCRALSGGIVNLQREGSLTGRGKEVTVYIKGFLSLGEQPFECSAQCRARRCDISETCINAS